ncbi:hypothetical protein [Methylocystis sp.]|uniref:hypothetical protein n=1 Tax=Methylocystis sp. TaxID=1911079 RepID=UPI0025D54636|nr:hypothetical protein [Methylocystis sp.]
MIRRRLPNRRAHEAVAFAFRGRPYTAGVGRFPDVSVAEIFIDAEKQATDAADDARDAAVTLSLAFQPGVRPQAIRAAVTRESDGRPSGIAGAVLDLLEQERSK